jgi:hypothetical protein
MTVLDLPFPGTGLLMHATAAGSNTTGSGSLAMSHGVVGEKARATATYSFYAGPAVRRCR